MSSATSLSQRLTQIVDPMRAAVAAWAGTHRETAPLVLLLWSYLHRLARRFAAAAARAARATPPAPQAPRVRAATGGPCRPRLPQGFGWLVRLAPTTAIYGQQLRHLLCSAEMAEMLAASPQAARTLRPLCRMLSVEPAPDLPPSLFPTRPATEARAATPPAVRSTPRPDPMVGMSVWRSLNFLKPA